LLAWDLNKARGISATAIKKMTGVVVRPDGSPVGEAAVAATPELLAGTCWAEPA